MAPTTPTKDDARDEKDETTVATNAKPRVGEADSGYKSPDLSFTDDAGEPPEDEKKWNEARNKAQKEDAERVEKGEQEATERRAKERAEADKKALEANRESAKTTASS